MSRTEIKEAIQKNNAVKPDKKRTQYATEIPRDCKVTVFKYSSQAATHVTVILMSLKSNEGNYETLPLRNTIVSKSHNYDV